ncbi:MAG: flagellar hook-length control protein [Myxococcales bacterium]|nr:flagellar hook-length control protein [Myxococcales bacterium]MCB9754074.1 flagellar hook-length control protein [Myxococcales bacterium]
MWNQARALLLPALVSSSLLGAAGCAARTLDDEGVGDAGGDVGGSSDAWSEQPIEPGDGEGGRAHGMTWSVLAVDEGVGAALVGCGVSCDPYVGDTKCNKKLPVLCLRTTGAPNPGIETDYYHGWARGEVALTEPVRGDALRSVDDADRLCREQLGEGFGMAEFHDGGGGWNWWAHGAPDGERRFWVWIDDQPRGNCF